MDNDDPFRALPRETLERRVRAIVDHTLPRDLDLSDPRVETARLAGEYWVQRLVRNIMSGEVEADLEDLERTDG